MRLLMRLLQAVLLLCTTSVVSAAASWGFTDATVSVQGKGTGVAGGHKEKFLEQKPITTPIKLGATDTLKVVLTAQEGRTAKRPHQAFLLLKDAGSKLDISYPLSIKENGKAKVDLTQKDIPAQLLRSSKAVDANIVIGSFGTSKGYNGKAFSLSIEVDPNAPMAPGENPLRYGKLAEIHHIFRSDPKSANVVISLIFASAVLATVPILLGLWLYLGANVNHLSKAFSDAPVSHALFYGSVIGIEGVFFMYYTSWNLFKTLPVLLAFGTVTFLSGSRALTEVQERRLAGLR